MDMDWSSKDCWGTQVVRLQHNDILDQFLDDGGLRGRREQHADPRGGQVVEIDNFYVSGAQILDRFFNKGKSFIK